MKIKVGMKFKTDRDKTFIVISSNSRGVTYKSLQTGALYNEDRKQFEKRVLLLNQKWNEQNKSYKHKKNNLD